MSGLTALTALGPAVCVAWGGAVGCSGGDGPIETSSAPTMLSPTLSAQTVLVRVAVGDQLAVLGAEPGWQAMFRRDPAAAVREGGASWAGLGRAHAELAALYRQAAQAQARAILQTFGPDQRREHDPDGVAVLVGASALLLGDLALAQAALTAPPPGLGPDDPLLRAYSAYSAIAKGAPLAELALFELPAPSPGTSPDVVLPPHYALQEKVGAQSVKLADPGALYRLSLWHEGAAALAMGEGRAQALVSPWRLAGEGAAPTSATLAGEGGEVALVDLFLGTWLTEGDRALAAALLGAVEDPHALLSGYQERSPAAVVLLPCLGASTAPHLDPTCTLDRARALSEELVLAMAIAAGAESADHRALARAGEAVVLEVGVRLARAMGDSETEGVLRLNSLDRVGGGTADPVWVLSAVGWDVGNRNPQRAQDLLHPLTTRLPALEIARLSIDALHLRVSRDAGPSLPMH